MSEVIVNLQWVIDHNKAAGQPLWQYIGNYGDVSYLDHGGMFLFKDLTGRYAPELEILEEPVMERGYKAYRICLDKCYYTAGVLSDNKFHKNLEAWFSEGLMDNRNMTSEEKEGFIKQMTSKKPKERVLGYITVIDYYGAYEFDQYPNKYTRDEAEERYNKLGVK